MIRAPDTRKEKSVKALLIYVNDFLSGRKQPFVGILKTFDRLIAKTGIAKNGGNPDILDALLFLPVLILCFFIFFYRLDAYPLRMWDEARNGINAMEMLRTGNFIVTFFKGSPEMWNTKPPLFIWIVAGLFKLLGTGELALRFPSALAASATVAAMYWFSRIVLKNRWVGFTGALVILSSMGFPDTHIGRTGDFDALLTFWVFLGSSAFFAYTRSYKTRLLYASVLFFLLAVYTKGVAAFFVAPGIVLYLILTGGFLKILKKREFWMGAGAFCIAVLSYYVGRNLINPGYLQAVLKEELFQRYGKAFTQSGEGIWYYWRWMASFRFQVWIYFVPATILAYFFTGNRALKHYILFAFILASTYFLIISGSENKNLWYDAQLYPLFSLLVAGLFVVFIERVPLLLRVLPLFILAFYMQRYIRTNYAYIQRYDTERAVYSCLRYGYLFRSPPDKVRSFKAVDSNESYCMPYIFYTERAGVARTTVEGVVPGDRIISCSEDSLKAIGQNHSIKKVFENSDGCQGIEVL